jgi:putative Holliday junction resolvase
MSEQRTLLGFDFGEKRIGIAVGQELTASSSPLATIQASAGVPDWMTIAKHINDWKADGLVVGIPYNMDGSEHAMTHRARQFASVLEERYKLPVYTVDERLSSIEAERILGNAERKPRGLKQKKHMIDQIAAQLILDTYFSQQGTQHHNNNMVEASD